MKLLEEKFTDGSHSALMTNRRATIGYRLLFPMLARRVSIDTGRLMPMHHNGTPLAIGHLSRHEVHSHKPAEATRTDGLPNRNWVRARHVCVRIYDRVFNRASGNRNGHCVAPECFCLTRTDCSVHGDGNWSKLRLRELERERRCWREFRSRHDLWFRTLHRATGNAHTN